MRRFIFGSLAVLTLATLVQGQSFSTSPCTEHEGGSSWFGHDERACEVRRTVIPVSDGRVSVTGKNGNIEVVGEDRSDIALEARVTAQASSRSDAESLLHEVKIVTAGEIRADGPSQTGWSHRNWSVNFKLRVPRRITEAALRTSNGNITATDFQGSTSATSTNGNITVTHVGGEVRASTTNGGLKLEDLTGTVHAETTNGGVDVALAGGRWQGAGLFVKSTNGGVSLRAPDHFAAHLMAETTNGGISVAFPITIQGKIGRHIDTEINGGGPPVHLETTNGGISIDRI